MTTSLIPSKMTLAALLVGGCVAVYAAPTFTVLYNFQGGTDGKYPVSGVVIGRNGVLYGTTEYGGTLGQGAAFAVTPPAVSGGAWNEAVISSFVMGYPQAGLLINQGVLYGVAAGAGGHSYGNVFSLSPPASLGGEWTQTTLYAFGSSPDAEGPDGPLLLGPGGVLYGTTVSGGAHGFGAVFALTPPSSMGGPWTETILYSFVGAHGKHPKGNLAMGTGGVLYGATSNGGSNNYGVAFSLTPPASAGASWTFAELYSFSSASGVNPRNGLVIDSHGVLYGTTIAFGPTSGNGTVFSLEPPASSGSPWTLTTLYSLPFPDNGTSAGVVIGGGGVLYGATDTTIFSLTPPATQGGSWTPTVLYNVKDVAGNLAIGAYGVLYGTTTTGGTSNNGTVFSLQP